MPLLLPEHLLSLTMYYIKNIELFFMKYIDFLNIPSKTLLTVVFLLIQNTM